MAGIPVQMPRLGMSMEEGTVVDWPLAIGSHVEKGELLLVIESEKNEAEIEATRSGTLRHIYVEPGDTVPCGTLLGALTEEPDEAFDVEAFAKQHAGPEPVAKVEAESPAPQPVARAATASAGSRKPVAPAARALAKKLGFDAEEVPGTGPGGRVTKQDVEAYAEARERLVPVEEGVALEVLQEGEGDCVVFLPGFGTDVSSFAFQTRELTGSYRVLAVNPRGVGLSDAPELESYEVARAAADALALFEGAAHVVGASLGAATALELAIAAPERVRSLTLITPFVTASTRLRAVAEAWQRVASEASADTLAAFLAPWLFGEELLADDARRARTLRGLAASVARAPAATLARAAAGMAAWSGSRAEALAGIAAPTLVLAGGADLLTPDAGTVSAAIPDAKLVSVPGAGHALAIEAAEAVNAALKQHLTAG
jgi:pyruvate dehydrogenase E2 component (dihydrolipoamide acetyltransferase)